jgi:tetratricopeptide (TPR) repeat protein
VKRALVVIVLLAAAAAGGAVAYQAAARQRDYSVLLTRGDTALRDDQTFAAIEAYSGAIALRPDSMLAHLRRGQTYQRRGDRGDLDAAARDFRTARDLDPTSTRPLEALGDVNHQLQRYDRAADAYESYLRLDDRSPRISYKLALAHYRRRDIDMALTSLRAAIRLDDRLADAQYLLGVCLREKERLPEALRAIERAIAIAPGMIPAREELADLYGALGRKADQLEQLQVLAALDRDQVARQIAVGMAHARARHWDLAVLTLGSALERNPSEPEIYRAIGQVWLERPREDEAFLRKAREALERVVSSPAATSESYTLYGRALLESGEADRAERAFLQATTQFPIDPSAFLLYASTAEKQNHLDGARRALIQYGGLIANDPDFVERAARIGSLSLRLNDPPTAVAWLTRAAAKRPNDVALAASLADAQMRTGDVEGAKATLAQGLAKDPASSQLLSLARRLEKVRSKK